MIAPDLIDNTVAPEVATSESSISVVRKKAGVITCVGAVRLRNAKLFDCVITCCLVSKFV
ncbi:MAG: hypothetical protein ACKPKO_46185 [Candidatus Fonsibacter sp.]